MRWGSYLDSALAVYKARSKLVEYVNSSSCTADASPLLRSRVDYLSTSGHRVLHDLVVFLNPLMDITIYEEGEYYIKSSVVVSRFLTPRQQLGTILEKA